MAKSAKTMTPAIRFLDAHDVAYTLHPYAYEENGGTALASRVLGVPEHAVIKTLVMADADGLPLLVLMHGDRTASTKGLARTLGVKAVKPCDKTTAHKHTGYVVGGISPFGTAKRLKVYLQESILAVDPIFINAGKRGLLVRISPADLVRTLNPVLVDVAI